jgi:hypothetical protein
MEQDNSHSPIKLTPKPSLSAEVKAKANSQGPGKP